eukprot:Amastigsp_a341290_34.p5 type:complete len:148 gc:universal Amastigsp_a341290_34:1379-936(-)
MSSLRSRSLRSLLLCSSRMVTMTTRARCGGRCTTRTTRRCRRPSRMLRLCFATRCDLVLSVAHWPARTLQLRLLLRPVLPRPRFRLWFCTRTTTATRTSRWLCRRLRWALPTCVRSSRCSPTRPSAASTTRTTCTSKRWAFPSPLCL